MMLRQGLAEIQHLKKLVVLNAAENHVSRIPVEVLRNLRSLKALVLNDNSITTLDWIPKLPVCFWFAFRMCCRRRRSNGDDPSCRNSTRSL